MCMLHSEFQAILFCSFVVVFVLFLFCFLLFLFCFVLSTRLYSKSIFKPDICLHSKLYGRYLWRDLSKYDSREVNKSATRNISLFVLFLIKDKSSLRLVSTLIKRRILWYLIWVYIVCHGPMF